MSLSPRQLPVATLLGVLATSCSLLLPSAPYEGPWTPDGSASDGDVPHHIDGGRPDATRPDADEPLDASEDVEPDTSHCVDEVCNGRDDDCDGMVDEDFDCPAGSERPCSYCGISGTELCVAGCTWGACAAACPGDRPTCCWESECVDTDWNANHCGGCGNGCAAGQSCCSGRCIDTSGDRNNCGGCGVVCDFAVSCCGGTCVSTAFSDAHCGRCFNPCRGLLSYCSFGECRGGG